MYKESMYNVRIARVVTFFNIYTYIYISISIICLIFDKNVLFSCEEIFFMNCDGYEARDLCNLLCRKAFHFAEHDAL